LKKFLFSTAVALSFFAFSAMAGEWTGYISDANCAKDPAKVETDAHAACAQGCAKKGAELVLVAQGKVYKLSDQAAAKPHAGHKVTVKGDMSGETITVESISM